MCQNPEKNIIFGSCTQPVRFTLQNSPQLSVWMTPNGGHLLNISKYLKVWSALVTSPLKHIFEQFVSSYVCTYHVHPDSTRTMTVIWLMICHVWGKIPKKNTGDGFLMIIPRVSMFGMIHHIISINPLSSL